MNIVISGASKGIGFEVAIKFANLGHRVLALARNSDKLKQLQKASPLIDILSIDLCNDLGGDSIQTKLNAFSKVDILINNAGQLINKPFLNTSIEEFNLQINANYLSSIRLIQWTYPYLLKSKASHIVNISSMGGFQGSSKYLGLSGYSASKGALITLTECLANEFKEDDISVNALALGAVGTEMLASAFPDYKAPLTPKQMAQYIVDFSINGKQYFNGKILPVALDNP
ncbi:MAG: SDR family NAD(P)-dependent oxidoreductase [Bacteroidetes bacterium]|nr:MAG: SDR family NAD(P)-dependent oxidoreductase [Bacteroidota bacterium]MBL1146050.1 SDR family oxidoreductase [Bacteroidota bacterium]NOG58844.1 SDR family oxidoreductase [Bacteroidota bacterium]